MRCARCKRLVWRRMVDEGTDDATRCRRGLSQERRRELRKGRPMRIKLHAMFFAACALLWLPAAAWSANLVVNGDFSAGNSGFSSAYAYSPGNCNPPAIYDIVTDPHSCHAGWSSFGDHTSGSGNMMVVNGSESTGVSVWGENVTVLANTTYFFSVWIASVFPVSPAMLDFSVNGQQLGSTFTASTTTGNWQQFYATWFSGASTTAQLGLVNLNTAFGGNDFALDDIVLDTVRPGSVPEPGSLLLLGMGVAALCAVRRRTPA